MQLEAGNTLITKADANTSWTHKHLIFKTDDNRLSRKAFIQTLQ